MAKLYFKFGAMGSSKTAQALMTKFNYEEKDKSVLLIKPATDNRDDRIGDDGRIITEVRSRIGLFAPATAVSDTENLIEMYLSENKKSEVDVIICDECQFLTEKQVDCGQHFRDKVYLPLRQKSDRKRPYRRKRKNHNRGQSGLYRRHGAVCRNVL